MFQFGENIKSPFYSIYLFVFLVQFSGFVFSNFPFETCYDFGSTPVGNCTVLYNSGAIGAESVNHVLIDRGYLDYGPYWYGCPYKSNTCPNGFSFYGWIMFKAYPAKCSDYGVVVSTEVFNIHLLGNGHLAVYAWLPNGTEYYAETFQPVMLDIFYPIVVQFQYFSSNNSWVLSVVIQSQLLGGALFGRNRTYTPPNSNLLFGGSGNGANSHNTSMRIDRTSIDSQPQDFTYIYQVMVDVLTRQAYCNGLYGVMTQYLTCYHVQRWVSSSWADAYKTCSQNAYTYGYSYGRLAWFPSWNVSVWQNIQPRIDFYTYNRALGYTAWIGGGRRMKWLDGSKNPVGTNVVVPPNVNSNNASSSDSTCLQVDTRSSPWQFSEDDCSKAQPYICQMSFDCIPTNPCKNMGVCLPNNDGTTICKCWPGTSGQFCENGIPSANCVNNCTCPSPEVLPQTNCAACLSQLMPFLTKAYHLKYSWKLHLLNSTSSSADVELLETVECNITSQLVNLQTGQGNATLNETAACMQLQNLYMKLAAKFSLLQNYINQTTVQNNQGQITQNARDLWNQLNQTMTSFASVPCVADLIQKFKSSPGYQSFQNFLLEIMSVLTS